ncbi:hypothetical protein [Azospirillum isscasi]|uniref:Uncharacterized protein n=1 Tax=Azospirillum isscasi TaxID=3053926 RepID=A0ABU0WMG7_9PROT|nr:hypothetical protein [Azospirillum isscasi]MDQ2105371.1 hypothetical protein [Azospirillum isscasi]
MSKLPKLAPAAAGALSRARATAVQVAVLAAAEREYSRGGAGPTALTALILAGLYPAEVMSAARRAHRRVPGMAADMATLPAVLEVGRRLAAERVGGAA